MTTTASSDQPRQGRDLLLVEDNIDDAHLVERGMRNSGIRLHHAKNAQQGAEQARNHKFDAIVLDHRLPDMSGVRLCRQLRNDGVTCPILILSSVGDDDVASGALAAGADDFIVKSLDFGEQLAQRISDVIAEATPWT